MTDIDSERRARQTLRDCFAHVLFKGNIVEVFSSCPTDRTFLIIHVVVIKWIAYTAPPRRGLFHITEGRFSIYTALCVISLNW